MRVMELRCKNCPVSKEEKCRCQYCSYSNPGDDGTGGGDSKNSNGIRKNTFKQRGIRGGLISLLKDVPQWNDTEITYAARIIRAEINKRRAAKMSKQQRTSKTKQKKKTEN